MSHVASTARWGGGSSAIHLLRLTAQALLPITTTTATSAQPCPTLQETAETPGTTPRRLPEMAETTSLPHPEALEDRRRGTWTTLPRETEATDLLLPEGNPPGL